MTRYVARRLLHGILVMWIVSTAVFVIFRLVPGDPAAMTLGLDATPEDYEALREELGLNDPTHVQYLRWMGNLARGDFGKSITHGYAEVSAWSFPPWAKPWNWLLSPYSWP